MGQDKQPKDRQKSRDLRRRAAVRQPFERLLVVCEGEKTEPLYLAEIRQELRLSSATVQVQGGAFGSDPLRVVEYAEHLFRNGDRARGLERHSFDRVIAVFDRDDHQTYHQALSRSAALNGALTNAERKRVTFEAVASVPCFELWLLLHYEDVQAPIHRSEVYTRLKKYLPGYDKGQGGHWLRTKKWLSVATGRAENRAAATNAFDGGETFTDMHRLVARLVHLKD